MPSRFVDELPGDQVKRMSSLDSSGSDGGLRDGDLVDAGYWGSVWASRGRSNAPSERRKRINRDGLLLEGEAQYIAEPAENGKFTPGSRVFHQKFGYGTVATAEGDKLEVDFDKAGRKKLIDSFVVRA